MEEPPVIQQRCSIEPFLSGIDSTGVFPHYEGEVERPRRLVQFPVVDKELRALQGDAIVAGVVPMGLREDIQRVLLVSVILCCDPEGGAQIGIHVVGIHPGRETQPRHHLVDIAARQMLRDAGLDLLRQALEEPHGHRLPGVSDTAVEIPVGLFAKVVADSPAAFSKKPPEQGYRGMLRE